MTQHFCCFHKLFSVCVCVCVIFSHLIPSADLSKGRTVQLSDRRRPTWLTDPVENAFCIYFSGCVICTVVGISGKTFAGEVLDQKSMLWLRTQFCLHFLVLALFGLYSSLSFIFILSVRLRVFLSLFFCHLSLQISTYLIFHTIGVSRL